MWHEVTLNLSSNVVGNSSEETNFCHNLLLSNTHVSRIRKANFANGSLANIKIAKAQLFKMIKLGGLMTFPFDPYKTLNVVIS